MDTETFSYSLSGERYTGEFNTREEAIEEAHAGGLEPGTVIYTGRNGPKPHARDFLPSIDDVLDGMGSDAFQNYDEGADDWPAKPTEEQEAKLQEGLNALADLLQSFDPPTFYNVDDIQPYTVPEV